MDPGEEHRTSLEKKNRKSSRFWEIAMYQARNEGVYVAESVMMLLIAGSRNDAFNWLKHLKDFIGLYN